MNAHEKERNEMLTLIDENKLRAEIERRMQRFESHIEEYEDTPFTRVVDVNKVRLNECTQILHALKEQQPIEGEELLQVRFWYWVWMRQYSHWENRRTEYWPRFMLENYIKANAQYEVTEEDGTVRYYKNGKDEWRLDVTEGEFITKPGIPVSHFPECLSPHDKVQETKSETP